MRRAPSVVNGDRLQRGAAVRASTHTAETAAGTQFTVRVPASDAEDQSVVIGIDHGRSVLMLEELREIQLFASYHSEQWQRRAR